LAVGLRPNSLEKLAALSRPLAGFRGGPRSLREGEGKEGGYLREGTPLLLQTGIRHATDGFQVIAV